MRDASSSNALASARVFLFRGSEAVGAHSGCPPGGGGPAGVSRATRVAKATRVPTAPEPRLPWPHPSAIAAPSSPACGFPHSSATMRSPRPQGTSAEPSQSPAVGRGENGWGVAASYRRLWPCLSSSCLGSLTDRTDFYGPRLVCTQCGRDVSRAAKRIHRDPAGHQLRTPLPRDLGIQARLW